MSVRRSVVGLAGLAVILAVGVPAISGAAGGPCSSSTPQYCPPPKVKTGPARNVTSTSATLTGTVNPNGSDTTCHFKYGRSTHYGRVTPSQNEGSGSHAKQVSAAVTGLTPNTVYHYELACSNLGGKATGGDRKFTTQPSHGKPPKVTTGRARHVRSRSATLIGTVNPNGSATRCFFQYGRTKNYGSHTPGGNVGSGTRSRMVRAHVKHLASKRIYHYRLVCSNRAGRRRGGDRHFRTTRSG